MQALQPAQEDELDHGRFCRRATFGRKIAKSTLVRLRLQAIVAPALRQAACREPISLIEALAMDQPTYGSLNFHNDLSDLSDALIAIAISMLAVFSPPQFW